jgi:hypothetical protein
LNFLVKKLHASRPGVPTDFGNAHCTRLVRNALPNPGAALPSHLSGNLINNTGLLPREKMRKPIENRNTSGHHEHLPIYGGGQQSFCVNEIVW